jgi:hypothetical protein
MTDGSLPVEIEHEDNLPAQQFDRLPTTPIETLGYAVMQGKLDVETMKGLMELEKEYRAEQARAEFNISVAKFSGLKQNIPHNKKGTTAGNAPFSYADFPQTVDFITPWLKKAGLSFSHTQDPPVMDGADIVYINVRCILKAKTGHQEESEFPAIPDSRLKGKVSPSQLVQMAVTYAKRQTLNMVMGLAAGEDAAFDDDANTVKPGISQPTANSSGKNANQSMIKSMKMATKNRGLEESMVCQMACGVDSFAEIPASRVNEVLELIKAQG